MSSGKNLVHIGPNGPGKCVAKSAGTCPFFPPEDHFNSLEEAEREYEARGERFAKTLKGLQSKRNLTPTEKAAIVSLEKILTNREEQRRERNKDLVAIADGQKMSPERARERLDHARAFAEKTNNQYLGESLKHAKVLSTGSFKGTGKDRRRISAGNVVDHRMELDTVDSRKRHLKNVAAKFLRENADRIDWSEDSKGNSFTLSAKDNPELFSSGGIGDSSLSSITVAIKKGGNRESEWNMSEFNKLKAKTKTGLMKKEERLDMEEAKKYLSPKQLESAASKTITSFTVSGAESGGDAEFMNDASPNIAYFKKGIPGEGKVSTAKVAEELSKGIGSIYSDHLMETGMTVSESKKELRRKEERLKGVAARHGGVVLMPGKNVDEGLVFRSSTRYDQNKIKAMLTPEQIKASTKTVDVIDKDRAKLTLDEKTYSKIFEAPVVSIRVNEKRK